MKNWQPTLVEVLKPRAFAPHPRRAAVTRTIRQPEIDELERLEAMAKATGSAANSAATLPPGA
ncbi:MAG: hypothetical protein JNK22_15530 [Rhodocyclaceae bacterium]|nr:hypothetical protein [Rhodocyclaceae bacterium]